jgi:AcrR family transcriptional regulator
LLEAANRIVRRDGGARLTIDAVAAAAGVSKGGVLYHFPSKDALIAGMLDLLLLDLGQELDQGPQFEDASDGAWLRSYVRSSVHVGEDERDLKAALLAAAATDPELLAPMRERYRSWQDRTERENADPVLATIVRLAAEGLWIATILNLGTPVGNLRAQVVERLLELTGDEGCVRREDEVLGAAS